MTAKHLTKNAMSHKLVFLAVGIAIAIIAAFSICATSQAKAEDNATPKNGSYILHCKNLEYIFNYEGPGGGGKEGKFDGTVDLFDEYEKVYGLEQNFEELYDGVYIFQSFMTTQINARDPLRLYLATGDGSGMTISMTDYDESASGSSPQITIPGDEDNAEGHSTTEAIDFFGPGVSAGVNVAGQVIDAQTDMPVPFANVAYCQYNPWGDMYLPVEGVEPVKTDMGGFYTLEGITEEMLPGKVFVYDGIKQIGESEPIWFFPEDMETLYMWPILINQEQPDPPVPPTPPDPPVPPGPNPPEPVPPVPPVPPTPVPTPDNPGGGIAQTSDNTVSALVIFAMVALLGAGVLTGRKLYNR